MATHTSRYNLSKPENTDEMQSFFADYADNMDTIDENLGGGGGGNADVVHLTQEEYDALPASKTSDHKIYMIENTFSEGELGRIDVNGMFIDTTNVLGSGTWLSPFSYTAVQDCFVYLDGDLDNSHFVVNINGVKIYDIGSSSYVEQMLLFPLKKGQTLTATRTTNYALNYAIYGVQPASNVVIIPDYLSSCYSTSERQIGCWTDGKPLYQKTIFNVAPNTVLMSNVDTFVKAEIKYEGLSPDDEYKGFGDGFTANSAFTFTETGGVVTYVPWSSGTDYIKKTANHITIQYTKTTDTAGSGEWTPHGTPTVHYSTEETCIGTWVTGKPLYQKTWDFVSTNIINANTWTNLFSNVDIDKVTMNETLDDEGRSNKVAYCGVRNGYIAVYSTFATNIQTITLRYTKTTD